MANVMQKNFCFKFNLTEKTVRNLTLVTEVLAELDVWCIGYVTAPASPFEPDDRYVVELNSILYKYTDVTPILEYSGTVDEIKIAAIRHFAKLIEEEALQPKPAPITQPDTLMSRQLTAIVATLKKVKETEPLYLNDPITLRVNPSAPPTEIYGLRVSPKGALYLMDANGEWHQLTTNDLHADEVIASVYRRLEKMFKEVIKEAA